MKALATVMLLFFSTSLIAAEYPPTDRWDYIIGGFQLEDEIVGERPGAIRTVSRRG